MQTFTLSEWKMDVPGRLFQGLKKTLKRGKRKLLFLWRGQIVSLPDNAKHLESSSLDFSFRPY